MDEKPDSRGRPEGRLRAYLRRTREPFPSALLVFPVYLLYQVGLALTPGIRNGADLVTDLLLALRSVSPAALWGLGLGLIAAYVVALVRMRRKGTFSPSLYGLVALEGVGYGVLMVVAINQAMRLLPLGPGGQELPLHGEVVLSLGAGFHEELLFRVVLLSGGVWVAQRFLGRTSIAIVIAAVILSSLVFSAMHYVGPLADPLRLGSFVFRFLAGCYFALVYKLRGFAVAVYTHAIYDIGVFALT